MNQQDIERILTLRLLIARAGSKDCLGWWDDDSLSSHAEFVLRRMFPIAPALAGRRLALEAAFARHEAVVPTEKQYVHLYRLATDNRDRLVTRYHSLEEIDVPSQRIGSIDEIRDHLFLLTGEPATYTVEREGQGGTVRIACPPAPADVDPLVHRAQTLAWAMLPFLMP